MDSKVATGIDGLDEILLGGISRWNNVLIEGPPGSGKTTLGLGIIYAGAARFGEPGVIVSFELTPEKLIRDARGFDWELEALIAKRMVKIVNASPAVLLNELRADDSVLMQHVREVGARRLLIDGLTPLKLYAEANQLPFREDLHALVEDLTLEGVTMFMTAEREAHSTETRHERYVFDSILSLQREESNRRVRRRITVEKSRGQDFIAGSHAMEIVANRGVLVYRRAQSRPKEPPEQPTSTSRISSGIAELNGMMEGGLYKGSITLVTGISGTGKTVAGIQFLTTAASEGKPSLLVSLDEHPQQLIRNAQTLGFDLQKAIDGGNLSIHYESPLELDLDVHFNRIVRLVEERKIECIVFDSVAVYETASPDEAASFLYALATFCKDRLITVYLNYESPELLGVSQISEELKGSHLVDNIVLLSYVEISTRLRRALVVPKVRGSRNQQVTREYTIKKGGIVIFPEALEDADGVEPVPQLPFAAYYGLLSRSPSRRSPVIEEAINNGDAMPKPGSMKARG